MKKKLSLQEIKERLAYNPNTGMFMWVMRFNNKHSLRVPFSGTINGSGYLYVTVGGICYRANRLAWALHYGNWPTNLIDHEDGDKTNNKINNLRDVTNTVNMCNSKKNSRNTSGAMGIDWRARTSAYRVRISVNGKRIILGEYRNLDEAIAVRKEAEKKYGYHPNHGRD